MARSYQSSEFSNRSLRVFVSSTFQDMHAERDELVKHVFPKIRKLCEERGVLFSDVDLRWGVTKEQKAEDKVLSLCFSEIDRCRPYFIGLLGERYGWVPDQIPESLLNDFDWLDEFHDRSVTEIEIQHAVLNNKQAASHAHFYFRDKQFINSLPVEKQRSYLEIAKPDEIQKYGKDEAEKIAQLRREKLAKLKQLIRDRKLPLKETFRDARELGQLVLADLSRLVEQEFPLSSKLKPSHQRIFEQQRFAEHITQNTISRKEIRLEIENHLSVDQGAKLLLGESGIGLSTLMARCFTNHFDSDLFVKDISYQSLWKRLLNRLSRGTRKQPIMISHFVGATSDSSTWQDVASNILNELSRQSGSRPINGIAEHPDDVREEIERQLQRISRSQRVMILIDGVDHLEFIGDVTELRWLPTELPENVSLLVSASVGKVSHRLTKQNWSVISVPEFNKSERESLINKYLSFFGKQLSADNVNKISSGIGAGNPRYVKVLLEELRIFGSYEFLNSQIEKYLKCANTEELYLEVLKRYEKDYDRDVPGLVSESLSLIWAARKGLSEAELLTLLGSSKKPLPRLFWSPLFLAIESSMTNRSGLLNFSNQSICRAVQRKFLENPSDQSAIHLRLSKYFRSQMIGKRRIDEELWQTASSEDREGLKDSLLNIELLLTAEEFNSSYYSDWMSCWNILTQTENPGDEVRVALQRFVEKSVAKKQAIKAHLVLAMMLHEMRFSSDAEQFLRQADELMLATPVKDKELRRAVLSLLGRTLQMQDKFEDASQLYGKLANLTWKPLRKTSTNYANAIGAKAGVLYQMGKNQEAILFFEEARHILKSQMVDDEDEILGLEHNLALCYSTIGRYAEAEQIVRRILDLKIRAFGEDHLEIVGALSSLAGIYNARGEYQKALDLYSRGLAIREHKLHPDHPKICDMLHNIAGTYMVMGMPDQAVDVFNRCLQKTRNRLGNPKIDYALTLTGLGEAHIASKKFEAALPYLIEGKEIFNQVAPHHSNFGNCLRSLGKAYLALGQFNHSLSALIESIDAFEKTVGKNHAETALSLTELGQVYWATGDRENALTQLKQAYIISSEVVAEPRHVFGLLNMLAIYSKQMNLEKESVHYQNELDSYRRKHNIEITKTQAPAVKDSARSPTREVTPDAIADVKRDILNRVRHAKELAESEITTTEFFQGWLTDVVNSMKALGAAVWYVDTLGRVELTTNVNLPEDCLPEYTDAIIHEHLLRYAAKQNVSLAILPNSHIVEAPELRNPTEYILLLKSMPLQNSGIYLIEIAQRGDSRRDAISGYLRFLDRLSEFANSFLDKRYHDKQN